ncbi:hypothetical protein [uncultured Phenylobacterium sp.]|uniref:hypothetical protein n=1 Tax=uncultured Phenylobacterium sp. TaxID=349273 RepID=UPI0025F8F9CD|nr:hypothetical protein [uncultured Phenylobacterium sp.]
MSESAAEFWDRDRLMHEWAPRDAWRTCGPMEIAYTLEALGGTPDGFARVLDLVGEIRGGYVPAGLQDVARGYRIGVSTEPQRSSGEPLGWYRGAAVLAWTLSPPANRSR